MAASNKPGPIHFVAIGLFMLSIILGVVAFLKQRDHAEAVAREKALQAELSTVQNDRSTKAEEITALKKLIGFPDMSNVGINDDQNPQTVLGAALSSISEYAKTLEAPNFNEAIIAMRASIDKLTLEKVQQIADYEELSDKYSKLEERHQESENVLIEKTQTAEQKVKDLAQEKFEAIAVRDKNIKALTEKNQQDNLQFTTTIDELESKNSDLASNSEQITKINDQLRDQHFKDNKLSFDIADGRITRVDHSLKLVWLNLGSADGLRARTTFSVYQKDNQSVGRTIADIKGTIEVVSILGPHEAEARIITDDLKRPIFKNDLVYTPIWEVGHINSFSFVGLIDLDGDKISDRDKLHEIIKSSGGQIDNEVDDQGKITGKGLTVNTRYLVLGHIPDVKEVLENEKQAIVAMQRLKTQLLNEARVNAVEVINLNEFLAFIGYHPTRRVWFPGANNPFNLQLGRRKKAVEENSRSIEKKRRGSRFTPERKYK